MKQTTVWVLIILVLAAAAAWFLNARQPVTGHPSTLETPPAMAVEQPEPVVEYPVEDILPEAVEEPVEIEPEPPEPLPELSASDRVISEVAAGLLGADVVAGWFMTEQLIQKIVATVDSLDAKQIAPLVLPVRPPAGKFLVQGGDEIFSISPFNADRYEPYAAMAATVDVNAAVAAYARYYPLFQQAYEELGYPDAYFNDRLVEVIDHLLATPRPAVAPDLVRSEAVFVYADVDLEALSGGQKILLRMGEEYRAIIDAKLVQARAALASTGSE